MRRFLMASVLTLAACVASSNGVTSAADRGSLDQGPEWNLATRHQYYTQDQGSQLMPVRWAMALKQPNGQPFMADRLSRYGYLTDQDTPISLLPVGFTINAERGEPMIGMTCAACHTREIDVSGTRYRIDGGPAFADFQRFLADLDRAVASTTSRPAEFKRFAAAVLGGTPSAADVADLRTKVDHWYRRYHAIVSGSLPKSPWGPARLDAIAMIFNRVTGLDLGPPPDYIIAENIRPADAPARYPFLWNASRQDFTQWPGFAENGSDLLALARNLGEVFGVFGTFHPQPDPKLNLNTMAINSANFNGLGKLEDLIKKIGPPRFPGPIDAALAARGEEIFNWSTARGGCVECHGIKPGAWRGGSQSTWATPILDVGTDTREIRLLDRTAKTGVLAGRGIPAFGEESTAFKILSNMVVGSIIQKVFLKVPQGTGPMGLEAAAVQTAGEPASHAVRAAADAELRGAFNAPAVGEAKYAARVMQGIWAAAPYLHNGSVPTLADLLEPVAKRPARFAVGPQYDLDAVGLARRQSSGTFELQTTDCSDRNAGNSRCGHEFGTSLKPDEKKALLEYLKKI